MKLLGKYRNGNYNVLIYENGTKIRFNDLDNLTPSFAESYDISVTEKCDGNCQWCYLGCNEQGKHGNLNLPFFNTLHPYTEIAINGNDLSHPDLEDFLIRMKDQKVISNMTVNQKHFERHYNKIKDWQDRGLLHGIGVSLVNSKTLDLKEMKNVVVHTIAGLLTEEDINKLKNRGVKLLILGYKILGRGDEYYYKNKERIESNIKWLSHNIMNIQEWFDVISFDNLSLEQLNMKSKIDPKLWQTIYMGDEGEFTYFIDAVNEYFALSSLELENHFPLMDDVDDMFRFLRNVDRKKQVQD